MLHAVVAWFVRWIFRVASYAVAALGAAVLAFRSASNRILIPGDVAALDRFALTIGVVFLVTGIVLVYLWHTKRALLPNEGRDNASSEEPASRGWLLLLAISLVALPLLAVSQLGPLQGLWEATRELAEHGNDAGLLGGNEEAARLILIPVMSAVLAPFGGLILTAWCAVCSISLLALYAFRSRLFPRVWLMSVIVQFALLFGTRAAVDLDVAGQLRRAVGENPPGPADPGGPALLTWAERHQESVAAVGSGLTWVFAGYAFWLPAIFVSDRVRKSFIRDPATAATFAFQGLRSLTRIAFEGNTYNNVDEMPVDRRERYQKLMATISAAEQQMQDGNLTELPQRVVRHAIQRIVLKDRGDQGRANLPPEAREQARGLAPDEQT